MRCPLRKSLSFENELSFSQPFEDENELSFSQPFRLLSIELSFSQSECIHHLSA